MASRTLLQDWDLSVDTLNTAGLAVTGIDAYDEIAIVMTDLRALAALDVDVRLSNDGGSSYRTGSSDYALGRLSSSAGHSAMALSSRMRVGSANTDSLGFWGNASIFEPGRSTFKTFLTAQSSSAAGHSVEIGACQTAEVNDTLLIRTSTSSCTSGRIQVYGVTYAAANFTTLLNRDFSSSSLSVGASIDILNIDDYDEIWWRGSGLTGSHVDSNLRCRLSNDGGSSYDSGSTDYEIAQNFSTRLGYATADHMRVYAWGDAYGTYTGRMLFMGDSSRKTLHENASAGSAYTWQSMNRKVTAEVNDALRIIASAGNITSGRLIVYGVNYG